MMKRKINSYALRGKSLFMWNTETPGLGSQAGERQNVDSIDVNDHCQAPGQEG